MSEKRPLNIGTYAGVTVALLLAFFVWLQPRWGTPAQAQFGVGNTWGGTSTGSGSAYTVSVANLDAYHAGYTIRFLANVANTGAATLTVENLSGALPTINIEKPGPSGPTALTGGEIQPGYTELAFDGIEAILISQQSPIVAGVVANWSGPVPPAGWLLAAGQAVSRTTYAALFNNTTIQENGTLNETTTITDLSSTSNLEVGYPICGADINAGTTVASIVSESEITISAAATGSGTFSLVFAPNGCGDGSTTFNVIDLRGRTTYGKDDMNGSAANRITSAGSGLNGVQIGAGGGVQTVSVAQANLPSLNFSVTGSASGGTVTGSVSNGAVTGTYSGTNSGISLSNSYLDVGGNGFIDTCNYGTGNCSDGSDENLVVTTTGTNGASYTTLVTVESQGSSSGSISGTLSNTAVTGSLSSAASVSGNAASGGSGTALETLSNGAIVYKIVKY